MSAYVFCPTYPEYPRLLCDLQIATPFVRFPTSHHVFGSPHHIVHQWSIKHQAKSGRMFRRQVSGSPWHFSRRQIWSPHQLHLNVLVLFLVLIPVALALSRYHALLRVSWVLGK